MPELPEIYNLAKQLNRVLRGKSVTEVDVRQEKCLNKPYKQLCRQLMQGKITSVSSKGKWIKIRFERDIYALMNLGMGADVLFHKHQEELPEKYVIRLKFNDDSSVTIRFWWFGHFHAVDENELHAHRYSSLGVDAFDKKRFTLEEFLELLRNRTGAVKSLLLNQRHIAGIGNAYIHDILFSARLHPKRKILDMSLNEKKRLFDVIGQSLTEAIKCRGLAYERDIYGRRGRIESFQVGYAEGKPCPKCKTKIQKIKTGGTSSYICPTCQK